MRAQSISDSIKRLVFAINRIIVINFAIISNNVMQSLIKFIELSIDNNFDIHSYTRTHTFKITVCYFIF